VNFVSAVKNEVVLGVQPSKRIKKPKKTSRFKDSCLYLQKIFIMSEEKSDRPFFDDSTSILVPIYVLICLVIIFGTLFFG